MANNHSILRFLEDNDAPRVLGQPSSHSRLPNLATNSRRGTYAQYSTVSSPSRYEDSRSPTSTVGESTRSRHYSQSSAGSQSTGASTAPSLGPSEMLPDLNQQITNLPTEQEYELPCLFRDTNNCGIVHESYDFEGWYRHSVSHFGRRGPPNHALCIFCDRRVFDSADAATCWRDRLTHIAKHFRGGWPLEASRPDFHVLTDLWKKGGLSNEDYEQAKLGTERPPVDGLKPLNWEPEDWKIKREIEQDRSNRVIVSDPRRRDKRRDDLRSDARPNPIARIIHH